MVAEARSQALIQLVLDSAGGGAMFGCPIGHTVLVKSIHVFNAATTENLGTLYWSPTFEQGWNPLMQLAVAANTHFEWNGWFVLNEQDAVLLTFGSGPARALVSGAVLNGPAQFPPGQALAIGQFPAPR